MKKLIFVLVLLVSLTSMSFAEGKLISTSNTIPEELRGEWFSVSASADKGLTWLQDYFYLATVSSDSFSAEGKALTITKIEKYEFPARTGYIFYIKNNQIAFTLHVYGKANDVVMFYKYSNGNETLRGIAVIKQ